MSDTLPPIEADTALQSALLAYLEFNPTPTDDQTHVLAGLFGYPREQFERIAYSVLTPVLAELGDQIPEEDEEDKQGVFLLAYYSYCSSPTPDQCTALAALLEMSLDELEAATIEIVNQLLEAAEPEDTDGDTDLDSDFDADDDPDDEVILGNDNKPIQLI